MSNYAVFVGVSNYYDHPNINNLPHATGAIQQLKDVLVSKGEFQPANMRMFIEQGKEQDPLTLPLKYSVVSFLLKINAEWNNIQEDDLFLFYFIGHGYGSQVKGDQLLMMDTCFQFLQETALSTILLTQLIRQIRARRKLLIFDCCRNEAEGTQSIHEGLGKERIREFLTLYACQPGELAWIPRQGKLPLLTQAFINAVEADDCLSVRDMNNKVIDSVYEASLKIHVIQTPQLVAEGLDLEKIGFLSRKPRLKPTSPSGDAFVNTIRDINKKLWYLYEKKYPHHAPSYKTFTNVAAPLRDWEQKIDYKAFRRLAFEFMDRGENADIYTISYMLRWNSDDVLFKPLIECLSARKYRGTVAWQALDALEVMLREEKTVKLLSTDDKLREEMLNVLRRMAEEHASPENSPSPFKTSVVWGKILQICKRIGIAEQKVFSEKALKRLERF